MYGWWVGGTGVGIWLYDGLAARSMDDRGKMSPMGGELDGRTLVGWSGEIQTVSVCIWNQLRQSVCQMPRGGGRRPVVYGQ